MYEIIDNVGGSHFLAFDSDAAALEYMGIRYVDYIYSILSSDSIVLVRPNGYILAYISTADGCQTVKSMSDWGLITACK